VFLLFGVAFPISHLVLEFPSYVEACPIYHLHSVLSDMLGVDPCSVSNILAFLNAVGLASQFSRSSC
jgi:hypothetical protein